MAELQLVKITPSKITKAPLGTNISTNTGTTTTTTTSPTKSIDPGLIFVRRAVQDEDAKRMSRSLGHNSLVGLFHNYEEVDESLLKKLREVVSHLMDKEKEPIEIEDVLELKPLFSHDSGRRVFAQLLREYNTDASGKLIPREISDESLGVLLYLMYLTLGELELRNGADYISGKIIAEMSTLLFNKKKDGVNASENDSEVKLSIKEHIVWQSLFFWEEYFWDTIAHSFQQKFGDATGDNYSPAAKEFLTQELKKFSKNMVGWGGLQAEAVAYFSQNISNEIGLELEQVHELVASIDKQSLPTTRKDKNGKGLKRFSVKNQPKDNKDPKKEYKRGSSSKLSDSSPPSIKS